MASIILTSLAKLTTKILSSFGSSPASNVAEELDKLMTTVAEIRSQIADAEKREIKEESVKLWLFELKQVAYDAEDILSDFDYELLRVEMERGLQLDTRKRKREAPNPSSSFFTQFKRPAQTARPPPAAVEEMDAADEPVKLWHFGAKQMAYGTEAMVASIDYEMMAVDIDQNLRIGADTEMREVNHTNPSLVALDAPFQHDLLRRIKMVMERFDEINKDRVTLCLREEEGIRRAETNIRRSTSLADLSEIYGREDDKNRIVNALLSADGESDNHAIPVVSIVAMGGMGKTTLAKLVYNDKRVEQHFQVRSWVWVSEVYDEIRLTRAIIESVTDQICNLRNPDELQDELSRVLSGKRFLLVLDDIWNEDPIHWETLQASLISGAKGSRVMITTRYENAASIMGAQPFLRLGGLGRSDCWALFCRHAFYGYQAAASPSLIAIGWKIVEKCKGVPLMVKTLGGLLSSETSEENWDEILTSDVWDLDEGEESILRVLRLSYHHLPAALKPCFTYCAVFPKGHEFEMERLVRMWVAQGFIHTEDTKEMEETGRAYVDDLLRRSLFQDPSHFDYKLNFTMHDLIHDLAKSIAGEECSIKEYAESQGITWNKYVRHLSIVVSNELSVSFEQGEEHDALRSLLLHPGWRTIFRLERDFFAKPRLQHLRVLCLNRSGIAEVPDAIGNLKQLRYLGLSATRIKRLPESLCNLYNLQTLDLQFCNSLVELPRDIKHLINLRHLVIHNKFTAPSSVSFFFRGEKLMLPPGIGRLTRLQTLPLFTASGEERYAGIAELKDLNDLQGKLSIVDLHNITHDRIGEAKEAKLRLKERLSWLVLKWDNSMSFIGSRNEDDEVVLESLQPHTTIQRLEIEGYKWCRFPTWLGNPSFSNVVDIQLSHCVSLEQLPALGQLPSLKVLEVFSMQSLRRIGHEFYGDTKVTFPSLQRLLLKMLPKWEEWLHVPEEGHAFPCLQDLAILKCPKITSLSLFGFTALKKLQIDQCEKLAVINGLDKCWSVLKQKLDHPHSESLRCGTCPDLEYLEERRLPMALETLDITGCPSLTKS
ncbi:putative disease resistance RPP13-like protein 1 [Phoenix dactylifera]|uniref:Disease resistance RPP13-like protein 1 n=1 Tax=Phoenix dactylifera TaxID=42345 RepID=A0A8B9APU2_PHODC|nr:putative disease resistance RPP13-like protein 1 [Phoenix dactylifera]